MSTNLTAAEDVTHHRTTIKKNLMPVKLALTNATGRQAASLARTASAVGYTVSAHIVSTKYSPLVAAEIAELPRTAVHYGPLSSSEVRDALFDGADLAFINTTPFDQEFETGKKCAEAAQAAGVKHIIYSSMPDHSEAGLGEDWEGLPQYKPKWQVEKYIRTLGTPATFVYTGIYHNNFTSLPYPLFCLREVPWEEVEQWDGDWTSHWVGEWESEESNLKGRKCGFEWQAPFEPDMNRPWVDIEHDFGPAILQIFKDGPNKWNGRRYAPVPSKQAVDTHWTTEAFPKHLSNGSREHSNS